MLALIIIIIVDLLVVAALFFYGVRGSEHHNVSLNSPAIKAMSGGPSQPSTETAASEPARSTSAK